MKKLSLLLMALAITTCVFAVAPFTITVDVAAEKVTLVPADASKPYWLAADKSYAFGATEAQSQANSFASNKKNSADYNYDVDNGILLVGQNTFTFKSILVKDPGEYYFACAHMTWDATQNKCVAGEVVGVNFVVGPEFTFTVDVAAEKVTVVPARLSTPYLVVVDKSSAFGATEAQSQANSFASNKKSSADYNDDVDYGILLVGQNTFTFKSLLVKDPGEYYLACSYMTWDATQNKCVAGEVVGTTFTKSETPTAISNVEATEEAGDGIYYNLAGQRVDANTKGIVICNGKKYYNK